MTRFKAAIPLALCAAGLASGAFARDSQTMPSAKLFEEMMQCRSITDAANRLACYDKRAAALSSAQADKELAILDKESVRQTEKERFGLTAPTTVELNSAPGTSGGGELQEIESTIVGFQAATRNKWLLQLADGSSWQTIEAVPYRVPELNMAVTVKKAALGSYLIRPAGWPAVRSRRVK